jgi:hypothetical protein
VLRLLLSVASQRLLCSWPSSGREGCWVARLLSDRVYAGVNFDWNIVGFLLTDYDDLMSEPQNLLLLLYYTAPAYRNRSELRSKKPNSIPDPDRKNHQNKKILSIYLRRRLENDKRRWDPDFHG